MRASPVTSMSQLCWSAVSLNVTLLVTTAFDGLSCRATPIRSIWSNRMNELLTVHLFVLQFRQRKTQQLGSFLGGECITTDA